MLSEKNGQVNMYAFACAASDFDAGRMGVYCDITSENPTHISPPPAFPIQPKADIGLSV